MGDTKDNIFGGEKLVVALRRAAGFLLSAILLGVVTGCELERSDNGQLDGFWQLKTIDTLATAGTCDMRYSNLTWAFQGKILELRNATNILRDYLMRFNHDGDSLIVNSPYIIARNSGDVRVDNPLMLAPFGINRLEEHFHILHLSSSAMTLESDRLRLHFRKY